MMLANQLFTGFFLVVLLSACPISGGDLANPTRSTVPTISDVYSSCLRNCDISGGAGAGITFCKNTCIVNEATKTKNADMCQQIELNGGLTTTQPLICYRYVAIASSDPSICDRLTEVNDRESCRSAV